MKLNIGNNNKHMGTANVFASNIRKFMVIGTLGFVVLSNSGCHSGNRVIKAPVNNYVYYDEPRYDGIEYVVQFGDTLTEIVAAYESDYNKILIYVEDIKKLNNINGVLREGITIKLVGVPESKLESYGYSADYSVIGCDVMVNDAYNWLLSGKNSITENEFNEEEYRQFNDDFMEFVIQYNAYLTEEKEALKQSELHELVESINNLLDQFRKMTGLSFDQHHQAYPIPPKMKREKTILDV